MAQIHDQRTDLYLSSDTVTQVQLVASSPSLTQPIRWGIGGIKLAKQLKSKGKSLEVW